MVPGAGKSSSSFSDWRMGLFIRTIGIARAKTKIGLANLVYNIKRLLFLRRIAAA
jgi:transposase, IS5 family